MESVIVRNLQPEFSPMAVVWSNTISDDTLQFKKNKFGCILYLFAEASRRDKVAGGNRDSITCNSGRAALGLGVDFDASDELLDRYAAVSSKGLKSVSNQEAYRDRMEAVPKSYRSLYGFGERRHCNAKLAKEKYIGPLLRAKGQDCLYRLKDYVGAMEAFEKAEITLEKFDAFYGVTQPDAILSGIAISAIHIGDFEKAILSIGILSIRYETH